VRRGLALAGFTCRPRFASLVPVAVSNRPPP